MKKVTITTAAALTALAAFCVWGGWVNQGTWVCTELATGE